MLHWSNPGRETPGTLSVLSQARAVRFATLGECPQSAPRLAHETEEDLPKLARIKLPGAGSTSGNRWDWYPSTLDPGAYSRRHRAQRTLLPGEQLDAASQSGSAQNSRPGFD